MSAEKKHDYHLVDPSPWPIYVSFSCLVLALGSVYYLHTEISWGMYLGFALLIYGIFKTSIKALELGKLFQGLLAFGAGILIAIQVVFNIGVNLGILPTKGLTLPFISYGGTSLILFMFLMGMVLRINFENKTIK